MGALTWKALTIAVLSASSLHAAPGFVADRAPDPCPLPEDASMIVEAAAAGGELWLREMGGELTGVRPSTNTVLLAPFRVSGLLRSSTGEIWALTYEGGNGVVWQREKGGWRQLFSAPIRGTGLRGLVELDGPGIVTTRLLLTPRRTVAFAEDVPYNEVTLSFAISGDSLWVGKNAGEWYGGLRRYSLETGEMVRVPLDESRQYVVQTVTAVVQDRPGCVLASLGLSHFGQDGLVVRACENGRLEVAADWDSDPRDRFSKHAAVFSLFATRTTTFASTFAGFRTVDDPEEPPEPWRLREVCGLHLSRPAPGVLAVSSQAIRHAAVGGASPFFIADDPSLWK